MAQGTYSSISAEDLHVQPTNQFAGLQEHDALVDEEPEPFPLDHTTELERIALQRPRNRDRAVYLFYFQNVGWLLVILYFTFAIAFMVALNFPRQYSFTHRVFTSLFAHYCPQRFGLSGGPPAIRSIQMPDWATG